MGASALQGEPLCDLYYRGHLTDDATSIMDMYSCPESSGSSREFSRTQRPLEGTKGPRPYREALTTVIPEPLRPLPDDGVKGVPGGADDILSDRLASAKFDADEERIESIDLSMDDLRPDGAYTSDFPYIGYSPTVAPADAMYAPVNAPSSLSCRRASESDIEGSDIPVAPTQQPKQTRQQKSTEEIRDTFVVGEEERAEQQPRRTKDDEYRAVLELVAYACSGVFLIIAMEQIVQIGIHIGSRMSR